MAWRAVTNQQWALIKQHLPQRKRSRHGGRPPLDDRTCFEGMLWILWTGAPWSALPERSGSKRAVHRRLKAWAASVVLRNLWRAFLAQRSDQQQGRWDECCIDGMCLRAKKGVHWSGRRRAAREHSVWYWPMARGLRSEYTWRRLPQRRASVSKQRWPVSKCGRARGNAGSRNG
jgi:transposase